MKKKNPAYLKSLNQKEICYCLLKNGPMTRATLAKELSMSRPTTSLNVQGLIEQKILMETSLASSTVGKKGTLLDFNPQYHHILIVDTSSHSLQNEMVLHVCNLKEEIVQQETLTLPKDFLVMDVNAQANTIQKEVLLWIKKHRKTRITISHVVFSIPGIVNNKDAKFTHFINDIEKKVNIACSFCNDINLALLGENYYQNKTLTKNMGYLRINQGLGAAFILNGQLYSGHNFAAGEIGFYEVLVCQDNKMASIPLHQVLSIHTILEKKKEEKILFNNNLSDFEDLLLGIQKQDPWCLQIINTAYYYLENIVINLCATLDLEEIIIAGAILQLIPDAVERLQQKIDAYPLVKTKLKAPLLPYGSIYGGYTLGLQAIMDHILV